MGRYTKEMVDFISKERGEGKSWASVTKKFNTTFGQKRTRNGIYCIGKRAMGEAPVKPKRSLFSVVLNSVDFDDKTKVALLQLIEGL